MDGRQRVPLSDAALDRELDAALGVEPSPEFLARVRQRVAEEPATTGWHIGWRWMAVCGAAASVILVMVIANWDRSDGTVPRRALVPVVTGSNTPAPARDDVVSVPTPPAIENADPVAPVRAPRPAPVRTAKQVPSRPRVVGPLEIIVAQDERRALHQLLTLIRRNELAPLPQLEASTGEPSGIPTVEIAPVVIDPLPPIVALE